MRTFTRNDATARKTGDSIGILSNPIGKIATGLLGIRTLRNHFFIDNFDKNSVIVDLGACRGKFSKMFSEKHPYSRIILVEPVPKLVQDIRSVFKNKENIEILDVCVGSKPEKNVRFYLGKRLNAGSLYKSFAGLTGESQKGQGDIYTRIITVDDIFLLFKLEKIDLLKIDIEGSEWDVFENFSKDNFNKISQISVEFHDFNDPSLRKRTEACIRNLRKHGYSFVHQGSSWICGTPYMNCLFYDRRRLKYTNVLRWLGIRRLYLGKI